MKDAFVSKKSYCDDITDRYTRYTVAGIEEHRSVQYTIEMHNEPKPNNNTTFNAQEVLDSELVSSLNKEYFVKNER